MPTYPIEAENLSLEEAREQAAVLAFLLSSLLMDTINCKLKVQLIDDPYKEYGVSFESFEKTLVSGGFLTLELTKNSEIITEPRDFKRATYTTWNGKTLIQKEIE